MTLCTFAEARKIDNAREVNWGWTGAELARAQRSYLKARARPGPKDSWS
jgi:hypothetical protein